jgi:dihydroflavonol-4-reductase
MPGDTKCRPYDINGFARAGRMLLRGEIPMVPNATYGLGSARAIALAHIAAAERGRLGRNYLLGGPVYPYATLVRVVGDALGIDGNRPVAPGFLLQLVGLVNDIVSTFTGKMPDLTMEIAAMVSHNGFPNSDRAVRELGKRKVSGRDVTVKLIGYDANPDIIGLIHESMKWLKDTNRL